MCLSISRWGYIFDLIIPLNNKDIIRHAIINPSPLKFWNMFIQTKSPKGYLQFEIIINVLVNPLRFIWLHVLWVDVHYKYFDSYSVGIGFRRQNSTSTDVRFWRLKSRVEVLVTSITALSLFILPSNIKIWSRNEHYYICYIDIDSHKAIFLTSRVNLKWSIYVHIGLA